MDNIATKLARAQKAWEQAHERALYEQRAWALMQQSRKAFVASYRKAGLTAASAQAEFEKHIEGHRERCGAAFEYMAKTAKELGALLRKKDRRHE
jgi:hypothetical protein